MGRMFGYARVSTDDQDLTLQLAALERHGVPASYVFSEHASGKNMKRAALNRVIRVMRSGDTLVIWKLDRLGRSLKDLIKMAEDLQKSGINLVSLTDSINTETPTGKLFFHFMGAMAEWERNMTSERTKAGMAARKAADPDVKWGAKKAIEEHPKRLEHLQRLYNAGEFTLEPRKAGGLKWKGMTAKAFVAEINAADKKARPVKSAATVERWFHAGAPGLVHEIVKPENEGRDEPK